MVGDPRRAMALCERSLERGVFAQAIRPADRARRDVAPAPGGDGQPHARAAAGRCRVIGHSARDLGICAPPAGRASTGEHARLRAA